MTPAWCGWMKRVNRSSLRALWSSSPPGWGLSPGMKTWAATQPSIFTWTTARRIGPAPCTAPLRKDWKSLGDVSGLGNLMDLDFTGSYLSGEVLRIYRPGDGYYDVNLATGQETKALDSQLEDAWGWQLTERYAVESTLLSRPLAHQKAPVDREQAMTPV